jgi:hypothetical protein
MGGRQSVRPLWQEVCQIVKWQACLEGTREIWRSAIDIPRTIDNDNRHPLSIPCLHAPGCVIGLSNVRGKPRTLSNQRRLTISPEIAGKSGFL